jgi:hypothetical protein
MQVGYCSGEKEMKSCVSSAYRWWDTDVLDNKELSGVVYRMNRSGPRTEPWGTPHDIGVGGRDLQPEDETVNDRDKRYDLNQL